MMYHIRKTAFTLAEVLITLGIIGIVAAMTMPVLIANYQKQVQVAQIKKVYSTFSQGIKKIMADESCTDLNCVGIFITNMGGTSTLDDNLFLSKIKTIFNVIDFKDEAGDLSDFAYKLSPKSKLPSGQFPFTDKIILSDSTALYYSSMIMAQAVFFVDVNGDKKPNTLGRDIFGISVSKEGRVSPLYSLAFWEAYCKDDLVVCEGNSSPEAIYEGSKGSFCGEYGTTGIPENSDLLGISCLDRIISDGWQMNY